MDVSSVLARLVGGQAQFCLPGGQFCCFVIRDISLGEEGLSISASSSWMRDDLESEWTPSKKTSAEITEAHEEGDTVVGVHEYGAFFMREKAQVRLLPPGHPDLWKLPKTEPLPTLEALLREHGVLTVESVNGRASQRIDVTIVVIGDQRVQVEPTTFICPFTNIVSIGITRLALHDDVITAEGWLKAEDGGMTHASRRISGTGKLISEAVNNAFINLK